MAKLGEIPQGEEIDRNHPDFWVVDGPDGRPHYIPRAGVIIPTYRNERFNFFPQNGAVIAESADLQGEIMAGGTIVTQYPDSRGKIAVGARVFIGPNTVIKSDENSATIIGDDTRIGGMVKIEEQVTIGPEVRIEDRVWIGRRVRVGPGAKLRRRTTIESRAEIGGGVETEEETRVFGRNIVPPNISISGRYGTIRQRPRSA